MARYDLDARSGQSKYQYLHHCIRDDIRRGVLAPGKRLPSKRSFARELGVSVNTVERAYALLVSEGYLEAKPGSGFVVRSGKDEGALFFDVTSAQENAQSDEGRVLDLKANRCSMELFPLDIWSRLMRQVLSERNPALLETVPFNGLAELRQAIAFYLYESKGILVSPARIIVGAGTEYLYGRLLQLLGDRRIIAIEDPGYKKFADVSRSYHTYWDYIPIDAEGISVDSLMRSRADVVHVSPANHFPSGTIMSDARRYDLLRWLEEDSDRYLIEDDYDSEIRYGGRPSAPLITQDVTNRVIYLNTFSKTLVPSLRISYMVLPEALMRVYQNQLSFYSCTVSSFEQSALARFISEGYFERHINKLRRYYKQQREQVLQALSESKIASISEVIGGHVGTHFLLKIATNRSDEEVKQAAFERGVHLDMLSDYCERPSAQSFHCVVVNFASIPRDKISQAVALMEDLFAEELES